MTNSHIVGMFLVGISVGLYLPTFPEPIAIINPYFGLILIGLAVLLFMKGN